MREYVFNDVLELNYWQLGVYDELWKVVGVYKDHKSSPAPNRYQTDKKQLYELEIRPEDVPEFFEM